MPEPIPYPETAPVNRNDLAPSGPGSVPQIWTRVAARVIDELLLGIPMVAGLVIWLLIERPNVAITVENIPRGAIIASTVIPLVYEFVALALFGATVGKWAMGVRVVEFAGGGRPRPYQMGLRVILPALGSLLGLARPPDLIGQLLSFVGPALLVSAAIDPLVRGLHDKGAGTIVLRSR